MEVKYRDADKNTREKASLMKFFYSTSMSHCHKSLAGRSTLTSRFQILRYQTLINDEIKKEPQNDWEEEQQASKK